MRYDEVKYGYFDGAGTYHAYVKDHQGNVRAVVAGGEAVERDDYYPYGMPIVGACTPSAEGVQPLKYTSKELDRFNRLDLYDFGARPYDPTRCAFLTGDPLAEDDPATGPTAFCAANPIRFTDPTGMDYNISIDDINKTITISAIYYTSQDDLDYLNQSLAFWNDLSGKFGSDDGYTVNFNLEARLVDIKDNKTKVQEVYGACSCSEESIAANSFSSVSKPLKGINHTNDESGVTESGKYILIYPEATSYTGAHEVGHSLGLPDTSFGLMMGKVNPLMGRNISVSEREILIMVNGGIDANPDLGRSPYKAGKGIYQDNQSRKFNKIIRQ